MNGTLQKCIEELKKDKPSLDYVRGMLETLMDMQTTAGTPASIPAPTPMVSNYKAPSNHVDEEVTDAYTLAYESGSIGNLSS